MPALDNNLPLWKKTIGFLASLVRGVVVGLAMGGAIALVFVVRQGWRVRLLRPLMVATPPALILAVIFTLPPLAPLATTIKTSTAAYSAAAGFRIDTITVEGRQRTQRSDLQRAVQLARGQAIFAVDLAATHKRIAALAWVREAVIMRRLPNQIHIIVREYEPFALYQDGKTPVLINRAGVKITRRHLQQFKYLPLFAGAEADTRAAALMDILQDYPIIRNRLIGARWTQKQRWTLTLDHGGKIKLPDSDITIALDRLMRVENQRRVLAVEKQLINLRYPDRILLSPIKPRPKAANSKERAS